MSICALTCVEDADCTEYASGTARTETAELGDVLTCQPSDVQCDSDSDCADGWKCNGNAALSSLLPGGSVCYPACSNYADCQDLGLDGATCETLSIPLAGSIKFCD